MKCPNCDLETESMLEIIAISFQGYCFSCEKDKMKSKGEKK